MINEYFSWLTDLACGDRYSEGISYSKLLTYLHQTEFKYLLPMDENMAEHGMNLRYYFSVEQDLDDIPECLYGPCSVLEMILALSMKCEELMDDTDIGNRTRQWFWNMLGSIGIGSMRDDIFDYNYVKNKVDRFLNREYEPNGKGGLFTIRNCAEDLRKVEIWYQCCWYLNSIT